MKKAQTGADRSSAQSLTRRTKSENPIVRATVDIGHVAGRLFICIGVYFGTWFIGIRRL
jgi:hypothetical protein